MHLDIQTSRIRPSLKLTQFPSTCTETVAVFFYEAFINSNCVAVLTVVLSALTGTSYISLRWLSSRLCWEWAWMIWLRVFRLSCLGGRAGGWPSTPSGDLRQANSGRKKKKAAIREKWRWDDSEKHCSNSFVSPFVTMPLVTHQC